MTHITRIQLINFHNFVNETIQGGQNIFLMGDNKSGKTTILDAVHFALTAGGRGLELNAAARFGNKQERSRNLASIFLRLDGPTGRPRRGPTVSYVAIEIREADGITHVFGAGAFTASITSEPDTWGFIVQNTTLEDLRLITERIDEEGRAREGPRDEPELAEHVGRVNVYGDKGRYRSALGKFLYHDRDAYDRVAELVRNAKSYRSIVAKAASLDDLFIELLPSPENTLFRELKPAITGLDNIRANLEHMETELGLLRTLVQHLNEAREESERVARLHFVQAERIRRAAETKITRAATKLEQAGKEETIKASELQSIRDALSAADNELTALRGSAEIAHIDREAELTELVKDAKVEVGETVKEYDEAATRLQDFLAAEREHLANAREKTDELALHARESAVAALEELDHQSASTIQRLIALLDNASLEAPHFPAELELYYTRVENAWQAHRDDSAAKEAKADHEATRLEVAARSKREEADEILRRGEELPPLPRYAQLLTELAESCPQAQPLYRLIELAEDTPSETGAHLEMLMGPRLLGTIVAPPTELEDARRIVLAHGEGIQIATFASRAGAGHRAPLRILEENELTTLALAHAASALEDLIILPSGASRGEGARALSLEGQLYDNGLESRRVPAPPAFIGREARRAAATRRADELRALAKQDQEGAKLQRSEQSARRFAKERAAAILANHRKTAPTELRQAYSIAAQAAATRVAQDGLVERIGAKLERQRAALERHQTNLNAVRDIITKNDLTALAARVHALERLTRELGPKRDTALEQAQAAKIAKNAADFELESAKADLQSAKEVCERRAETLRPFVDLKYQQDLVDYAFRIKKGEQFASLDTITREINSASESRAGLHTTIRLKSQDELLWQKYAFVLHEETQDVRDQAGRTLEEVASAREKEVREHQETLDEKTRDLFDRVLMDGLVKQLLLRIDRLEDTLGNINKLCADLVFGSARFRFDLRVRPEYKKILRTMRETSILDPAARDDIKDFFQARIDQLKAEDAAGIPNLLDYRAWFHYVLQTKATENDPWVDLTSENMGFGSTGEQAVPNHMLIIAVGSLLYDDVRARLRVLLLDEAFLGIDGSGRDVLLRFADRCKVDLIVATPELDGLTPALASSTTLLVEKTAEGDVFVRPYEWNRAPTQTTLSILGPTPTTQPEDPA